MSGGGSFVCPVCGNEVERGARRCRECGSDDATGWSETADDDSIELPDATSDEEHDDFLARELPDQAPPRLVRRKLAWALFGIVLAALFLWWSARRR